MPPGFNWRSSATYEYLTESDPAEFAWEYLRRNPQYQQDYQTTPRRESEPDDSADASARLWGLRFRGRPQLAGRSSPVGVAGPS